MYILGLARAPAIGVWEVNGTDVGVVCMVGVLLL
jgi:hypothetical protein